MALNSSTVSIGDTATASQYNNVRKDVVQYAGDYASSTGSANAYALTVDSQFALTEKVRVKFKANFPNTGAATLDVNGGGAVAIKIYGSSALVTGDILSGQIIECIYDGTNWQMVTPSGNARQSFVSASFTFGENIDGTTTPQAVYLKASDTKVYKTVDSGTESTYKFIGFTRDNVTTNNVGTVITAGIVSGFPAGLTDDADYFLNGTGAVSTTPGTNYYKVCRAASDTSMIIEKGPKILVGSSTFNTTSAANNDLTIDVGFRAQKIKIYYHLQGHGAASGTAKFETQVGEATWINTTIKGKRNLQSGAVAVGDNTAIPTSDTNFRLDPADYTDTANPVAGTTTGTGAIQITLSVNSITDSSVVLRRATVIGTSPNTARCNMYYEIYG